MRALVTGAAGSIGSTLVDRLLSDGHQVVGIDNFRTGIAANLERAFSRNDLSPRRFTLVQVDIQAPEVVDIVAGANPRVIIHLAAQVDVDTSVSDPQFDARSNVLGIINLCEASRQAGVRRIVYAASGESRYGAQARLLAGGRAQSRRSPLASCGGQTGRADVSARLRRNVWPGTDLPGVSQRLQSASESACRGGGDRRSGQRDDHRPALRGVPGRRAMTMSTSTMSSMPFVRAGCAPLETTGTYNIGTGRHTTVTEVHGLMSAALDGSALPSVTAGGGDESNASALNATKADKELSWKPKIDLEEGIQRTIRWLCATLEPEPPAMVCV